MQIEVVAAGEPSQLVVRDFSSETIRPVEFGMYFIVNLLYFTV